MIRFIVALRREVTNEEWGKVVDDPSAFAFIDANRTTAGKVVHPPDVVGPSFCFPVFGIEDSDTEYVAFSPDSNVVSVHFASLGFPDYTDLEYDDLEIFALQ